MADDKHPLQLAYVLPSSTRETSNFVKLEQEKWDPYVNILTKLGVVAYLNKILLGGADLETNCSGNEYRIFAYPSRPDLAFIVGTSHGTLSTPIIETVEFTEALQCDMKTELTPKYPVVDIIRFDWVGDAYGLQGDVVSRPILTDNGETIGVSVPVYGTVLVTYTVFRHVYTLDIHPLEGATENALQAWIYACWDFGNEVMECKFPDGAETEECNNRDGDTGTINDVSPPGCIPSSDEEKSIDWCKWKY
jgi:hypothetical protein